jgi:hypothetical protein
MPRIDFRHPTTGVEKSCGNSNDQLAIEISIRNSAHDLFVTPVLLIADFVLCPSPAWWL